LINNLRKYTDIPIILYTDEEPNRSDVMTRRFEQSDLKWHNHLRWGVRNCNVLSAMAAMEEGKDGSCCLILNDDMRVVSNAFLDGFHLAERFGVCVPLNPRIYVKYNAMGADTLESDFVPGDLHGPAHAPACNMSPMFYCCGSKGCHSRAYLLLSAYSFELKKCMRGTLAFWKASWQMGVTPLYLPEQWCVGASNAKYFRDYKKRLKGEMVSVEPIMLHWGQAEVRKVFQDVVK
jgi:hypothetical protein